MIFVVGKLGELCLSISSSVEVVELWDAVGLKLQVKINGSDIFRGKHRLADNLRVPMSGSRALAIRCC